ncbi:MULTISPECIES: hypothetical protein [Ureibacillus]|jgi:hypothetical protein|uniref:hypothetical protein n=1 Tax=Ureibacillus TaxID=160795 RepID=UPI0002D47010|nr:hypothetical protein [Ureibacillus thermosphaericus]
MKKIIFLGLFSVILGFTVGMTKETLFNKTVSADSPLSFKVEEFRNGKPFNNNVELSPETGTPVIKEGDIELITVDSPKAEKVKVHLKNGVTGEEIETVTMKEFLKNQDKYNKKMDDAVKQSQLNK